MGKIMRLIAALLITTFAATAWAQTYVRPHLNKDGSYTEGHYRSAPNRTDRDNYGTKGNVNPYTQQDGTVTPKEDRPTYTAPKTTYSTQCGYTVAGRYVCK
jgi:hypothetical protein